MRFDSRTYTAAYSHHSPGHFPGRAARGSVPPRKAICQVSGERVALLFQGRRRAHSQWERPRGVVASPGPPASLGPRGCYPKQDALSQFRPVGMGSRDRPVAQRRPWIRFGGRRALHPSRFLGSVLWRRARPTSTAPRRANAKNAPKRRATISFNSKCWRSRKSGGSWRRSTRSPGVSLGYRKP
jgi:hypothetical protein